MIGVTRWAAVAAAIVLGLWSGIATAGTETIDLAFAGDERPVRVHGDLAAKGRPVVFVIHGGGGNIEGVVRESGMDALADEKGFLAVYPSGVPGGANGTNLTWNTGECCGAAKERNSDDPAYFSAVIDELARRYAIDETRVYATGISNGAMMSYRLACELSTRIAAVAPVSGVLNAPCEPAMPVAILHIHGTADRCATYRSGSCGGCFNEFLQSLGVKVPQCSNQICVGAEESVAQWAARNGCAASREVVYEKGATTCLKFQGCPSAGTVELCRIEGGGHTWAGGVHSLKACTDDPNGRVCRLWEAIVGKIPNFPASAEMWEFFARHAR